MFYWLRRFKREILPDRLLDNIVEEFLCGGCFCLPDGYGDKSRSPIVRRCHCVLLDCRVMKTANQIFSCDSVTIFSADVKIGFKPGFVCSEMTLTGLKAPTNYLTN